MKGVIPQGHLLLRDNIVKKDNLFGFSPKEKARWAEGLNLPKRGERILFAGCGYQFMPYAASFLESARSLEGKGLGVDTAVSITRTLRKIGLDLPSLMSKLSPKKGEDLYTPILRSAVNFLRRLGVEFAYLGEDEPCCGSPIYYSGFIEDFAAKARDTYRRLKSLGVKEVIGLVPACTNTLKNTYPKFVEGYDLQVKHYVEFVAEILSRQNVDLTLNKTVTVHDPCQLARFLEISDVLREVLSRINGLVVKEVPTSKELTTCCGGGGGMELTYPELSLRIASNRVKELAAVGAEAIVTCCPGCVLQLREGAKMAGIEIEVLDLAQLLELSAGGGS